MLLSNGCYLRVAVDTVCQVMQVMRHHVTCVFTVGHQKLQQNKAETGWANWLQNKLKTQKQIIKQNISCFHSLSGRKKYKCTKI